MTEDKMNKGGAQDPNKYKFIRAFAGASLGSLISIMFFMVISITVTPTLAESYEKVSGILIMLIGTLGAIVGGYMGVSNAWGRK